MRTLTPADRPDRPDSTVDVVRDLAVVVDADPMVAAAACAVLEECGLRPLHLQHREAIAGLARDRSPSVVIADATALGRDRATRAEAMRALGQSARIVVGADLAMREAVEWMRLGASDVLSKPIDPEDLRDAVRRALDRRALAVDAGGRAGAATSGDAPRGLAGLVGSDPRLRQAFEMAAAAARVRSTVLVEGESGTGKSRLARAIHAASPRAAGPFVEVACGSLSDTLLESELFGHVRGAFTGALADKKGRFLAADGGTLFLDEINSAPPAMQVKLLRVLQERCFEPVGSDQSVRVDVRVIAATNQPLAALVADGRFRQDLFYRVHVMPIALPPLRERPGDVAELAHRFLDAKGEELGRVFVGFTEDALAALARHAWPGNVRELENAIERAAVVAADPRIRLADLPPELQDPPTVAAVPRAARERADVVAPAAADATADSATPPRDSGLPTPLRLSDAMRAPERRLLLEALERAGWNRSKAAIALGINRATLYRKMRELGLGAARDAG